MPYMRRANEQSQTDWRPIPEGVWRFLIGKPEVKQSEQFGSMMVRFPLVLTEEDKARVMAQNPLPKEAGEGVQQSWRTSYTTGLSLGYMDRTGQYKSTKLTEFLGASFGQANRKAFLNWITNGGGPARPEDKDDQQAELNLIEDWLGWVEGMEILGSIRHEADKAVAGQVWARFGGPMAVGSLPGAREEDYQAAGLGKLRAMIADSEAGPEPVLTGAAAPSSAQPAERFNPDGSLATDDGSRELPF